MVRYSTGYGYGFRFSGCRGAARVRQAGRFTRHSFRVNLPCQPTTFAVLRRPSLLHPFRPRPFAFSPAPYKIRPCPSRCRWRNAGDVRPSATNGNHRQQSTTRRDNLCGTAAKWRIKAVAVGIVGSMWVIVACSSCVRFFFGTRQAFAARKNDTRHRRFRWLNAKDVRPSETNGNSPTTPDFLRHCLCGTAA